MSSPLKLMSCGVVRKVANGALLNIDIGEEYDLLLDEEQAVELRAVLDTFIEREIK